MGAVCTKPSAVEDSRESPRERFSRKGSSVPNVGRMASSKRHTSFRVKERVESGDGRSGLLDKKYGSRRVRDDHYGNKVDDSSDVVAVPNYSVIRNIPKATEGEQVAAGWPSWLAAVAGEAINGWLPRRADTFEKLDKIGQGTYSNVYKAHDLTNKKFVALKRVRFDEKDPESIKFMAREILILRKLDHPNIIKLEGLVTSRRSCSLYLVFEYMEHDLTGLASIPGVKFSEPQVKCYMQQLLSGLDFCHSRGVLHRDIKGSNLLIDNQGILKIADFGLASYFDHHQNLPLTSRVVTLWYRPPELILGETHYGASVDLWSTGCILGELYAGKPIMPGRTEVEQMHRIFRLCGSPSEDYWRKSKLPHAKGFKPLQPYKRRIRETFKDLPPSVIGLMDTLLSLYPTQRGTAARALKSEYFSTEPLACDPSCLPKYPPSKELDAKRRDDEIRRQGAAGGGAPRVEQESGVRKQPWGAPNANAELSLSMQRRQGGGDTKSRSEYFYPYREDVAPGFPIDPSRDTHVARDPVDHNSRRASHSGPLAPGFGWTNNRKNYDDLSAISSRADLSTLSGLVASRTSSEDSREKPFPSQSESTTQRVRPSGSFHLSGPVRKSDRKHQAGNTILTRDVGNGRASMKEPTSHDHGFKGNKIHFSGPILVPSNNVDQMLKEQDRRIQEAARRARIERARARVGKVQAPEMPKTAVR